jgi:tetratricopeptide (TPR) repeat protein
MSVLANALRQAGLASLRAGRFEEAIANLQKALQADPNDFETWTYLGAARARMGEHDLSRQAFGKAVQIDPQSAKARYNLGQAHQMAGDIEAARVCFEAAVKLAPDYVQAQEALAKLPPPKAVTMSELAGGGGSIRLPGAHRSGIGDEEVPQEAVAQRLTPAEIARLSAPQGHIHMMGAQATDYVDPTAAPADSSADQTPDEPARETPASSA